ncbi:MAG TPA: TIGR00730 family Rossman fold protein [Paludibacteraceae bacterium]|nr:TIGR00730 family Rossman fold protein [Paludibacteraceae bacterium]HPT42655.1 TIGR00730 family Rossman fold protein [Paludibacteraceae bacterium]
MKVCVFCSSSNNIADRYKQSAFRFGQYLAEKGMTLVFGGATGGLMDAVAEGAKSGKGEIIGVIPEVIIKMNRLSALPTQQIIVNDMSERKKRLKQESDVFVVLPGGFGTLDEMFDVIASGTVGEHRKPLICINEDGFYSKLLDQIERMQTECFTPKNQNYKPVFVATPEECMEQISNLHTNK